MVKIIHEASHGIYASNRSVVLFFKKESVHAYMASNPEVEIGIRTSATERNMLGEHPYDTGATTAIYKQSFHPTVGTAKKLLVGDSIGGAYPDP